MNAIYIVLYTSLLCSLLLQAAVAAPLPLHWHWLERKLPKEGVQPLVEKLLDGLPNELCKLTPSNLTSLPVKFMDEVGLVGMHLGRFVRHPLERDAAASASMLEMSGVFSAFPICSYVFNAVSFLRWYMRCAVPAVLFVLCGAVL